MSSKDDKKFPDLRVVVATEEHLGYVDEILQTITAAAKVRAPALPSETPDT